MPKKAPDMRWLRDVPDKAPSKKAMNEIDRLFAPEKKSSPKSPKKPRGGNVQSLIMNFISSVAARRAAGGQKGVQPKRRLNIYRPGSKA